MQNNELKIAIIQGPLAWHDAQANREYFDARIKKGEGIDLFVVPEMFNTGFTMEPSEVVETMEGATVQWMKTIAIEYKCGILGSVAISENGFFYNRLIFATPDGELQTYDKRHLFSLAGEDDAYTAGRQKLIVEYKGWKICPLVCYDLRFPVFARNVEDYDILIFVANWPEPRINAWDILLPARAVENMAYVIGVNRTGKDRNDNMYPGHSQIVDPMGKYLLPPDEQEGLFVTTLNKDALLQTRQKLGFLDDRDQFKVM